MDLEFNREYIYGYTAALQDTLRIIGSESFQYDLKHHKRKQNSKTYKALLKCMIKNRAALRENPDAFVRCNDKADGGFEIYISGKGVYDPETRRIQAEEAKHED